MYWSAYFLVLRYQGYETYDVKRIVHRECEVIIAINISSSHFIDLVYFLFLIYIFSVKNRLYNTV